MITPLRQCANGGLRIASDGLALGCCDACEQLKSRIVAMCEQHGFYCLHKTGYLYNLTDTTTPLVKSTLHWITWTVENSVYVWRLNSIDCDCNVQIVSEVRGVSVTSIADFGYGFFVSEDACNGLCEDEIAILVAQAIMNGWDIKGGGVVVRKTSEQYPCYRFDLSMTKVALLIDTGTSFIYIGCNCVQGSITSNYSQYGFLEYDSCDCFDIRELVLTYPEAFAIEDVSFGEDTIYHYYNTGTGSDNYDDNISLNHSYQGDAWYCDYTKMYVAVDNTKVGYSDNNPMTMWTFEVGANPRFNFGYQNIEFVGKIKPFTTIEDNRAIWGENTSLEWKGNTAVWNYSQDESQDWEIARQSSKADAEAILAEYERTHSPIPVDMYSVLLDNLAPESSFGPTYSHFLVSGKVVFSDEDYMWHVIAPHYEFTNRRVYIVNYIPTSKGFLVNPSSDFHKCVTFEGTDNVPAGVSVLDPQSPITKCIDTKDMGGCHDKDWWDAIIGQYGEDEEENA